MGGREIDYQTLVVTQQNGITTVTLNRPDRLNALNNQMYGELGHALDNLKQDRNLKVLIITGAGRAFSAGGDIPEILAATENIDKARERLLLSHGVIAKIGKIDVPIIAAVNGDAVGAGGSLSLACDLRIASETARFGFTQVKVGLAPDLGASFFLSRLVGAGKACEMGLLGGLVSAQEAERLGLVNRVVSPDKLESTVSEIAERLARGPSLAIILAKSAIYGAANLDLAAALRGDINNLSLCLTNSDAKEGLLAFQEKRRPLFHS